MTGHNSSSVLRFTLRFIGVMQVILGIVFTFAPNQFAHAVGLGDAPAWALWMLTMFGARAWGFAYGMFLAARDPERHAAWIRAMIAVQAVDWISTAFFLLNGSLTLMQVTAAAFLPVLFIIGMVAAYPRSQSSAAAV